MRHYELSDHLGNVLATVLDRKLGHVSPSYSSIYDYWNADVVAAQDYYPFGMQMPERTFSITSSSGYRFGFNGQERDNEISESGNHLAYNDRGYDPRLARWNKVDGKQEKSPAWSPYHFGFNSPIITIDPDGKENIVVAGGQYDGASGNKLMFVNQALRQLGQYQTNEAKEARSLILFTEGYTASQIRKIELAATKFGASVVKVKTAEEFTNYVNSRSTANSNLTLDRTSDPATNVDIFAHGLVGSIEFGYKQDNANEARFDASNAIALRPAAFGANALITSYACRTGLGNANINVMKFRYEDVQLSKSLAQDLADATKVNVRAYLSRTDYKNTLSSKSDRIFLKMYSKGILRDGGSILHNQSLQSELSNRETIDGATLDPDGAMHPVTGGSTPLGVDNSQHTYTPQN